MSPQRMHSSTKCKELPQLELGYVEDENGEPVWTWSYFDDDGNRRPLTEHELNIDYEQEPSFWTIELQIDNPTDEEPQIDVTWMEGSGQVMPLTPQPTPKQSIAKWSLNITGTEINGNYECASVKIGPVPELPGMIPICDPTFRIRWEHGGDESPSP